MSGDLKQRLAALSDEQRRVLAQRLSKRTRAAAAPSIGRRSGSLAQFPLSFAQQRLWFLNEVAPLNEAFNVVDFNRVSGPFDVAVFERTLNEIVRRHEALRTVFTVVDGEPFQRVLPSLDIQVEVEDVPAVPAPERQARLVQLTNEELSRPWSLENGPLIRGKVWRLAPDDHVVGVILHHIVSDGWSKNVLVRELAALFGAFSRGETSPLPDLPIQYGDFTLWQRQWIEGQEFAEQLAHWKRQMDGAATLQLPSAGGRTASSSSGLHRWLLISSERHQALKALSQSEGATLFMTLLAAFVVLLSRYTGQQDIVVGSPVANRNRREVEDLIGCFMNPLPLRVGLDGRVTFRQLVGKVRDVALAAYANQDVPFDVLVRHLPSTREAGMAPLFQVLFLLQNFGWQHLVLSGSELVERPITLSEDDVANVPDTEVPGALVYPVALEMFELGDRLAGCFQYSSDFARLFAHVPAHFERLLDGAIAAPDVPVATLPFLSAAEQRTMLGDWACSAHRAYEIQPVHRLFEAQVARTPDRSAVVSNGARVSYRELNVRANQLARYLVARGVGPDVPVGIILNRSIEAVVAIVAVLKAGGAYVPLDPNYPSERQGFVLRDAGVRLVVTDSGLVDRFLELVLPAGGAPAMLTTTVCVDLEAPQISRESELNLSQELSVENLAYLIYTSGSTGTPKGTMISHASLANAYFAWRDAYRLTDEASSHLQMASISFDVFSGDLVRALCAGGKLVLVPQELLFSPADLYQLMRAEQVDCAEFVPAVVRDLVKYVRETGQSLDFVRLLIVGSDSWYASEYSSIRALCGADTRLINSYGVSEATIDSSYFESEALDLPPDAVLPIGRSFANTGLYVLDEYFQLAAPGVSGELCIGGPGLARGYLNRPDATAERFVPHPFATEPGQRLYRTGDLARFLADGSIELLGRIDNQVKLRGFRIEVGEIESVLAQHDGVSQSVVVLREDEPGDKRLVAYVVGIPDRTVGAPELRRFVRDKLPEYMVPSAVMLVDALPLLPNGKVNRGALPAPEGQRQSEQAFVAPANEIERGIADVWKQLLRVEAVGVHDNFFDLGGHSLLVIQLHSRLSKKLGRDLAVLDLFIHPTIHALASKLGARPGPDPVEFDVARDRAAKQRDANRRRRLSSEARGVAR